MGLFVSHNEGSYAGRIAPFSQWPVLVNKGVGLKDQNNQGGKDYKFSITNIVDQQKRK